MGTSMTSRILFFSYLTKDFAVEKLRLPDSKKEGTVLLMSINLISEKGPVLKYIMAT